MSDRQEIDRLRSRLQWERAGPLASLSSQATDVLIARLWALVEWLRGQGKAVSVRHRDVDRRGISDV